MPSMASIASDLSRLSLPDANIQSQHTRLSSLNPLTRHSLPDWFPPWLVDGARARGIVDLTPSQFDVLDCLHEGQHVYLSAPTASGRSLTRQLALFQSLITDTQGYALAIFAHKAREHVQFQQLTAWNDLLAPDHRLSVAIYDGDTPVSERRTIRQRLPQVVLTTPEMLHAGILAYHSGWRALFQSLKLIMIPDLHRCDGALPSHLCHLIRRLQRLARHYGSNPQYLLTASPVPHSDALARTLIGHTCKVVRGEAWQPHAQHQMLVRTTQTELETGAALFNHLHHHLKTPTLVLAPNPDAFCAQLDPPSRPLCPPSPDAYPEAELKLLRGEASAIVLPHNTDGSRFNTSAVQCMMTIGLPTSLIGYQDWLDKLAHQPTESLSLLILNSGSPLERLLIRFPEIIHGQRLHSGWQRLPLTLHNPFLLQHHLLCAASEISIESTEQYAGIHQLERFLRWMVSHHALMQRTASREWVATQRRPHRRVNLRWFERPVTLINRQTSKRLGRLSPVRAFRECLEGSTYRHHDTHVYQVERFDTDRHRIILQPSLETGIDKGRGHSQIAKKRLAGAVIRPHYRLNFGALDYTETIETVERFDPQSWVRRSLHMVPGGAERHIRTQATWISLPLQPVTLNTPIQPALHMLVHATLAMIPAFINLENNSIGGGVYQNSDADDTGWQIVFADRDAGGSGMAAALYQSMDAIWAAALAVLQQCTCLSGCQQCMVLACDTCSHMELPSREAGIKLLQMLLNTTITTWSSLSPSPSVPAPPPAKQTPRYLYLGLTTQKTSDDVGGWQHRHLLGLGLAMTYDTHDQCYRVYTEETVDQLIDALHQVDGVIGFNTRDFEYQVLQAYTVRPLPSLPTCAMLDDVQQSLGYRVSLSQLVRETLDLNRPDYSLQSVGWYQNGETDRLIDLCQRDLHLIRELVRHGARTKTLNYQGPSGEKGSMPVTWTFSERHG